MVLLAIGRRIAFFCGDLTEALTGIAHALVLVLLAREFTSRWKAAVRVVYNVSAVGLRL